MEKVCGKCALKTSPRSPFNFGNSQCMQENSFENKIF